MKTVVEELKRVQRIYFPRARPNPDTAIPGWAGGAAAAGGLVGGQEGGSEPQIVCAQCFCSYAVSASVSCPAAPEEHAVCEGCFGHWVRQQLAEEERARFAAYGARIVCPLCLPLQSPFVRER